MKGEGINYIKGKGKQCKNVLFKEWLVKVFWTLEGLVYAVPFDPL
jgi:hypothetical protein